MRIFNLHSEFPIHFINKKKKKTTFKKYSFVHFSYN